MQCPYCVPAGEDSLKELLVCPTHERQIVLRAAATWLARLGLGQALTGVLRDMEDALACARNEPVRLPRWIGAQLDAMSPAAGVRPPTPPPAPSPLEDRLILPADVALRLGISVRTVSRLIQSGALRGFRVGTRTRIRESSLLAYLVAHRTRQIR